MKQSIVQSLKATAKGLIKSFLGAVTFYTIIRIPSNWQLDFVRIARWSPLIGLLLGGLLACLNLLLHQIGIPDLTASVFLVSVWVGLTGGLHLDGVMDTADGLAVFEPKRRLAVMQDSLTGAFGVMAAVLLLLLKTASLNDLASLRCLALIAAPGWGRWAQLTAIAFYPYLKPTGKGAFHKQSLRPFPDVIFGLFPLFALSAIFLFWTPLSIPFAVTLGGMAIALLTGYWFYSQLGGHTGDTYGAVVEWTEALLLCLLTSFHGA